MKSEKLFNDSDFLDRAWQSLEAVLLKPYSLKGPLKNIDKLDQRGP